MIIALLTTDNGTHPPEKLAGATLQRFLDDFRENAPNAAYNEVMRFNDVLQTVLTGHHSLMQQAERSALRTEGPSRLIASADLDAAVEDAVSHIMTTVTARTADGQAVLPSLVAYFRRPETLKYFDSVIRSEFAHSIMLERSWHAQGYTVNQDCSVILDHPEIKEHVAAKVFLAHEQHGHALLKRSDDELAELGGREMVLAAVSSSIAHLPSVGA